MKNMFYAVTFAVCALSAQAAESIWVKGAEREMNALYGFAAEISSPRAKKAEIRFSAASAARVWVNGKFAAYGPARAAEGYMRFDVWQIGHLLEEGRNVIAVEVANSAVNEFYFPEQPAFFNAEVIVDGRVLAATGRDFKAMKLPVVQKTSRFSYQRGFSEFYRLVPGCSAWRTEGISGKGLELVSLPPLKPLPRGATYPDMSVDSSFAPTVKSFLVLDAKRKIKKPVTIEKAGLGPFKGFPKSELEVNMFEHIQRLAATSTVAGAAVPCRLKAMEGLAFEGARNTAGFPMLEIECVRPATVWLVMDEFAGKDSLPDPVRFYGCANAMGWRLEKPGRYSLESMHPYGLKSAHVIVEDGEAVISSFKVRSYLNADVRRASIRCSDKAFEKIFEAAKQSLACNAVDLFTDCPGRERGAYFGDTVFTARGADVLMGDNLFERTLYENYALASRFKDVPEGMIPMCYPADVTLQSAHWIPNFGLWSVVQLADYLRRSGDRELTELFRPKAEGLLRWFRRSRNDEGLLENLPGWVFVEWSNAANFVKGISFATNMTYIRFLDAFAELYGAQDCADEAERLRRTVNRLSWDGEWYRDNATRDGKGNLVFSGESTELNQYLAFFSGVATKEKNAELWSRVLKLGPMREKGLYPKLWPSNLLFGYSLRFILLSEAGESARVLKETRHLYLPMAEKTGTLWESVSSKGYSCCHGFPSMAAWQIARDALGLKKISRADKTLEIKVPENVPLEWCEGVIPLSPTESVSIKWRKENGKTDLQVRLPTGWKR